jgi:4-hydroxybenzoate polyprenyltransferase
MSKIKPVKSTGKSPVPIVRHLFKAMRPEQWGKNIFVFTGILFSKKHLLLQPKAVIRTVAAFALFCLISSSIYLINDLADKKNDQRHPLKRFRPIASGNLPPWIAAAFSVVFLIFCIGSVMLLAQGQAPPDKGWLRFGMVLSAYFFLQLAYSFALKQIVFVDLFVITTGFVLRAIGGALVISVFMTPWWLLCIFFLALFLGLGKRRDELFLIAKNTGATRRTLLEYSPQMLDQLLTIDVACIIILYSQAAFTAPLALSLSFPFLMLTVPLVVYALFRYLYLIQQKGERGEPVEIILHDGPLVFTIIVWGLIVIIIQSVKA